MTGGSAALRFPLSVTPSPPNPFGVGSTVSSVWIGFGLGAFFGSKGTYLYPKKNFPGGRERTAGTERVGSEDREDVGIIRGLLGC